MFKVFVANPEKTAQVERILVKNTPNLIKFLTKFQTEKDASDAQFVEEKELLIKTLKNLEEKHVKQLLSKSKKKEGDEVDGK